MRYLKNMSNYTKQIILFDLTHIIRKVDLGAIDLKTLMIFSG